ncbi:MAG: hypothetical protein A3I05_08905 [Deltaproteobacteria bacterium RIFCSPLOWO2_02_FULL_44_10]|nr:MAG: hypothetical protein A3C46_08710 [Deltaproteobacteria bacterium RIFCSPHIGHO2_02_FULL_44_16]OGQ45225.1 MAG: hypothetical protein A3I05_08905 [Deltaproteobacteria bacterium RIFCSPLOWO2_02_FULL_44_10]
MKKIFFSLFFLFVGCATDADIFNDLGNNIASPTAMAVDSTNRRLYLVNSNNEVLYDWKQGSVHVIDITNPTSPVRLNTLPTKSFSGDISLDLTNRKAFVSNRFSENPHASNDQMLTIDIDESSTNFLSVTETSVALNPFGIACCFPNDRLFIGSSEGVLQFTDRTTSPLTVTSVNLKRTLTTGETFSELKATNIAIINNQAFLSREEGGVVVVNLDEVSDTTVNPVDYFIFDIGSPRGIATDGTRLYVVDESFENSALISRVLVLDVSSLTPVTENTTVAVKDKNTDSLFVTGIDVGRNPQQILIASGKAYVTSSDAKTVSVLDLTLNAVEKTIGVGKKPFSLGLDSPAGVPTTLYVGNLEDNTISIIDIPTLSVVATYP